MTLSSYVAARVGIVVGTVALMLLTVVFITGGFIIDVGPLYFSAHGLVPPFLLAVVASAIAVRQGRDQVAMADADLAQFIDRHAPAIVVVLAVAAAGVGVAFGTYVASGSDSSAYLNQARSIAQGTLATSVPLASRVTWPEPEWAFAPLGYRPGLQPGEIVPTYPPGLSLVMAIPSFIAGDTGPFLVGPLFAALAVLSTYSLGARLHSRTAGVIGAALMTTSPVLLSQVVQQMSDIPSTALWAVAVLAALSVRPLTAGALSGLAVLMRPSLLPVAAAVAVVLTVWSDRPPASRHAFAARFFRFGVAMMPGIGALAWIQWRLYGHPLTSGHGSFGELFAAGNIVPNIRDYSLRVLTGETSALALIAVSVLALALQRRAPAGKTHPTVIPSVRIAVLIVVPVLTCYLAYGVFPDWNYIRFLLPIWPAALATAGALVVTASVRLPAVIRTQVLVVVLTAACARNVVTARNENSFTLWIDAARYATAGRYLEAAIPKNAVIVTSQHSGSAHYYTGRPILRWDSLHVGLDEAVDALAKLGHPSVILVEEWEASLLRQKFPGDALAQLDWPARADFGYPSHVRLYDPADRDRSAGSPFDRLP